MGSDRKKGGLKTEVFEILSVSVKKETVICLHLNAQCPDPIDLHLEDIPRQSKFRDADTEHSSEDREGFNDRSPHSREVSNHLLLPDLQDRSRSPESFPSLFLWLPSAFSFPSLILCNKPLQEPDGNGLIHLCPQTGLFAEMVADEPADSRQGIDLPDQFQSLFEFSFGDQSHIASRILMNRTGLLAGRKRDFFLGGLCLKPSRRRESLEGSFLLFDIPESIPQDIPGDRHCRCDTGPIG